MQPFQANALAKYPVCVRWMLVLAGAALFVATTFAAAESETAAADNKKNDDPIQITADQLVSNNEKKYAEFIGNVKASQADYVITSDKLRIYYRGDLLNIDQQNSGADKSGEQERLKKIVATGNVKIKTEQFNAVTDRAELDTKTMTIVLAGDNSKVISGKNSIAGSKITLYQKEGRVKVEGGKNKRIKAIFYSEGSGTDAFKIEKSKE